MAWGVFTFTRDGRQRLANVLRALLIAQLVVSLMMIIFCYNTSVKAMLLLKHIHPVTVRLLYGLVLLQTYCIKLHYTSGLRLLARLLRSPHWERSNSLTQSWMMGGLALALNGGLVYTACRETLKELMKELFLSLRIGISQYLTEPTWKRLLDTMQVELSCCGAEKPSDWHEIPWINVDFLNEDNEVVMRIAGSDGKVLPAVSPFSCCTPRVLAPCYHDPLQQQEWWWWGAPPPTSLQARGCAEALRGPLTRALLALQVCTLLVALLQIIITALMQLLRTSVQCAVLSGDADSAAPATLFTYCRRHSHTPNLLAFGKHCHNYCGKWMQRRALPKDDNFNYCVCCGLETIRQLRRTKTQALSSHFTKKIYTIPSEDIFDDFQVDKEELTLIEESLVTD